MKSLDIVRESISKIKNKIEKLIPTKSCNNTLPIERVVKSLRKNLENQIIIEKDLEVLEIIRKKRVNVIELKIFQFCNWDDNTFLHLYNLNRCDEYKLTLEELLKLKHWLEREEESKC